MGLWGLTSSFLLFSTLPAPFLFPLRHVFFLPWNDFAELYRQSDWFLRLHRPLQRAPDNELLLLKRRVREGLVSAVPELHFEPWMRNDPLAHTHWRLCHWRISPCDQESWIPKDTFTPMFTAALFTIARAWKQLTCPSTEGWIKMWCIYIHNGIWLSHKKEWNSAFADMDGPWICYTQWNKS